MHDVATQTRRVRHNLEHAYHLRPLAHHATRHDKPYIARAQNGHPATRHAPLQVHEVLRTAGRIHARRATSRHVQRTCASLARTRGQNHGARRDGVGATNARNMRHVKAVLHRCVFARRRTSTCRRTSFRKRIALHGHLRRRPGRIDAHDRSPTHDAHRRAQVLYFPIGVFGAGKLDAEAVQPEPVVDALLQNAPQPAFPVNEKHLCARIRRSVGGSHTGRAAADNQHVALLAAFTLLAAFAFLAPFAFPVPRIRPLVSAFAFASTLRANDLHVVAAHVHHQRRPHQALVNRLGRQPLFARHDLHHLGRAEPAMAATHHGTGAPLERIERKHRQRPVQSRHHFRLRNLAAAADHVPPSRVGRNSAGAFGIGHVGKARRAGTLRVEIGVFPRIEQAGHLAGDVRRNGGCRRKPRRIEAGDVEETGGVGRLPHHEIAVRARRAQSGKVGYHAAHARIGPCFSGGFPHEAQTFRRG